MRTRLPVLVFTFACVLSARALAHPGSGIVIDRLGQIYFVDMVSGIWKLDSRGALTHTPGPAFHWMTIDPADRYGRVQLPSGSTGDVVRIGADPTLLLASDFPIAVGRDGNLYYPTHAGPPVEIMRWLPSGQTSSVARLPATTARGPFRDLNGLAAGPDASFYYTEDAAIRRVGKDGRVSTVVENVAPKGCASPLLRGLDVDAGGTIYVAATGCAGVLKVTPAGQVTILPQVQNPWSPTGVALFGKDVYALEFKNPDSDDRREMVPRIRRIAPDGKTAVIVTVTRR